MIVQQIRTLIRQGRLNPGDRLPPERDLCARFGVSQVTVREALPCSRPAASSRCAWAPAVAPSSLPTIARLGEGLADLLHLSPLVVERATEEDLVALERLCEQQ